MYSFFVMRGMRAFVREWLAAVAALTIGSVVFGLLCVKYGGSDKGAAFTASAVISLPAALMILQGVRRGRPKVRWNVKIEEQQEERESLASFATFWRSLDSDEREGLQWLTSMIAANMLTDIHDELEPPIKLHPKNVEQFEQIVRESGQREVLLAVKGGTRKFVRVRVNHRTGQVLYSMKLEDA